MFEVEGDAFANPLRHCPASGLGTLVERGGEICNERKVRIGRGRRVGREIMIPISRRCRDR